MADTEFAGLYARLDDFERRSGGGAVCVTDFLTPRECHYGEKYLRERHVPYFSFGGYESAERKKLCVLPEYMSEAESYEELLDFGFDADIAVLRIEGSGFRELSHRDILGSLMSLGIKRSVLGDIVVDSDGYGGFLFCDEDISAYLIMEFTRVANDKIKLSRTKLDSSFVPTRKTVPVTDTVPSQRLDCAVAALLSLSREKAKECVLAGLCEVDHEPEEKCDRQLTAPCLISIRGHGRFRILSLEDKTKKGRIRLIAERFV